MVAFLSTALKPLNPHVHTEGECCPWCEQTIPNDRLAEISSRIEAKERERTSELTARLKEQFAREKNAADAKAQTVHKADLEAARAEARTAAEKSAEEKLTAAETSRAAALKDVETLKAAHEATLKTHAEELRLVLDKEKIAAVLAEQAKAFDERQKFQQKIIEMQRQLENKTAQDLGDGPEVNLFEALKAEFPEDRISRVDKGVSGADVIHDIHHNGRAVGRIVYDSKNRNAWRNEYVTKLRQDQVEAKADHAVLASKVFPAGVRELHHQDGVLVISPPRVLVLAALLRKHVVQTHALRMSNEARSHKTEALYAFIMSERFTHLVASIDTNADDIGDLDRKEEKAHQAVWKRRAELIRTIQRAHADLASEIERIIGTRAE